MKNNFKKLQREQIFAAFESGQPFPVSMLPGKESALRKALGITQGQMAKRLGTKQSSFNRTESALDTAELQTIARVAKELNCEVLITFKPAGTFEEFIRKHALIRAEKILKRTYSNMALEEQAPDNSAYEKRLKELTDELSEKADSSIWED
ncbi:MAG: hypothetical protein CVV21_05800 [Candidatus Goldiibacteriota bacterium HGW-Goldbacteria-1]|jgi:predicted DNA-binding mobile mystery protein A|nr:MAG: hypothetical protein CVV21_05800 [Candidatus Goldiibacteriota bacterium HGW-Goldbacteria-1]